MGIKRVKFKPGALQVQMQIYADYIVVCASTAHFIAELMLTSVF